MIVEKRVCDVYGTGRDVRRARVTVEIEEGTTTLSDGSEVPRFVPLLQGGGELGLRARERLLRWVRKGLARPGKGQGDG